MRQIITLNGFVPIIGKDVFLADSCVVIGNVQIGDNCSVWFNAVIRGDVNGIRIGNKVNIQDAAIIHCTYQKTLVVIEDNVSIGHRAIIHGCELKKSCLIGMGAIVMDNAVVGKGSIVAAGALVTEGTIIPDNSIYAGVPAKFLKKLDEKNEEMIERIATNYVKYASWYKMETKNV